jgi:hypothetical protein
MSEDLRSPKHRLQRHPGQMEANRLNISLRRQKDLKSSRAVNPNRPSAWRARIAREHRRLVRGARWARAFRAIKFAKMSVVDRLPQLRAHHLRNLETLPLPSLTARREAVAQIRGLGVGIQLAGLAALAVLWMTYGLWGAAVGVGVSVACYLIGTAKLKPWRCGKCKNPLATAQVRVCPACLARLVGAEAGRVMPTASR